jgi:hypothetical protein
MESLSSMSPTRVRSQIPPAAPFPSILSVVRICHLDRLAFKGDDRWDSRYRGKTPFGGTLWAQAMVQYEDEEGA